MLLDHNKEAYDAVKEMLLEHRECCLVAATGIGKSNIASELIKELNLNALVVAPKRSIRDNWAEMPDKYGFPATISTVTYQYFARHYRKMYGFDIYVFDEAHHADSEKWGQAIRDFREGLDVEFVLGLTADPIRYFDKDTKNKNVVESVFNGHVVYGHSVRSAINGGILPRAAYICAIFDSKGLIDAYSEKDMTDELRGRLAYTRKNCEAIETIICRHAPKSEPIKGIIFVDCINNIDAGVDLARKSFPEKDVYYIHSKLSNYENAETLSEFKSAKSGFIVAVDMLNEGLHIEGINMIIMLRKTLSPTIYAQQIGRGLAARGKDVVIYDLVRNETSIKEVLSRIDDMEQEFQFWNNKMGTGGERRIKISRQSIVKDYATDILKVLKDIDRYNNKNRPWTEEEDQIIRDNYPSMGGNVCNLLRDRTIQACYSRARFLGIKNTSNLLHWSEEEDEIIKKYYPSTGVAVCEFLDNKTEKACRNRAAYLGVEQVQTYQWSEEEDKIIRDNYPNVGSECYLMLKGRTKNACANRANALGVKYNHRGTRWTNEEDRIIIDNYPKIGTDVVNLLHGRTKLACRQRAEKLNVKYVNPNWTEEEDRIIKENYPTMGPKVSTLLHDRTEMSCQRRASELGIKSGKRNIWTEDEDRIIKENYPTMGPDVYKLLPRRTARSCTMRAKMLSLEIVLLKEQWTEVEDRIIKENYPTMGTEVYKLLPKRSRYACYNRARRLNITRTR